jgi:hypothetical protein
MIIPRTLASLVLVSAAIVCTGGCKSEWSKRGGKFGEAKPTGIEPPQYGGSTLTGASVVGGPTAVDQLVDVRCTRAANCNQIGPNARFNSRTDCVEHARTDMKGKLPVWECSAGVEQAALTACIDAIKKESCEGRLDVLDTIEGCGLANLCPFEKGSPR